jgi:HEAT repeat protein
MRCTAIVVGGFFLLLLLGGPAGADPSRTQWMADKLVSGKNVLDYELALTKFVKLSDPIVLPTLLKLVDGHDEAARTEAAGVLWHYNTVEVRKKLVELSTDLEASVRIEAAKSLCLMKYSANVGVIIEATQAEQTVLRTRALRALAEVGGEEAREAAEALRKKKNPEDRVWSAYALYRLGVDPPKQLQELERHLLAFPRAAWLPGKRNPNTDDLERAAKSGAANKALRLAAASALSRIGDEKSLTVLVRGTADRALANDPGGAIRLLLRHRDDAATACVAGLVHEKTLVRLGAVETAGRLRLRNDASRGVLAEALGKAVQDDAKLVRLAAIRAITKLELQSQAGRLAALLEGGDTETRRAAARAVGQLDDKRYLETLISALNKERSARVRRAVYLAIAQMASPRALDPMFSRLKKLFKQRKASFRASEELPLCTAAVASAGDPAAERVLRLIGKLDGDKRALMIEVLALTGSKAAFDFFMDELRESPPTPDAPAVRFFDSLDERFTPELERLIESETGMWIRVVLARALFRLGKKEYGRGILWGLKNEDQYYRKLAASAAFDLQVPGSVRPLTDLLDDDPETAWYAARALISNGSYRAKKSLLNMIESDSLRRRRQVPVRLFWEGARTARNPFAKEVNNERVWVLFAEDRIGGKLDLFLTWSADGSTWTNPVFSGLTSFADPSSRVPPPTFSLKVRGHEITIGLTNTFAQSNNPAKPRYKTLQRLHKHKLKDFFKDQDSDGLKDIEEQNRFTNPARLDTDGDGLSDGKDKNPLAKPANPQRADDLIKLAAFNHALIVTQAIPATSRLLIVEYTPGTRRPPELPTWPWLVLHLNPDQAKSFWRSTGGSAPRIRFGPTSFKQERTRATQVLEIFKSPVDRERIEVSLRKRGDIWAVTGVREIDWAVTGVREMD